MKVLKKIMNAAAKIVLCSIHPAETRTHRGKMFFHSKVIHRSWSFTEELVVAVFVLITLMAAALACREGELVNLSLVTDRLPKKLKNHP